MYPLHYAELLGERALSFFILTDLADTSETVLAVVS